MFQNIKYKSTTLFNYLKQHFNKVDDLNLFLELINKDYISISGSSILQIIQNQFYNDNSAITGPLCNRCTDIDIYIEINNLTNDKFQHILELTKFLGNLVNSSQLNYMLDDLIYLNSQNRFSTNNTSNYSSLRKYIKLYHLFTSKTNRSISISPNFKIEVMYIKCSIEYLLINSFDYDIVKNYWKQYKIYSFNSFAISNKIATMTLKHFIERIILGSKTEFKNFLTRYIKYTKRGFIIFIHKTNITNHIINHIIITYYLTNNPQISFVNGNLITYNNNNKSYKLYYTLNNSNHEFSKIINYKEVLYKFKNNLDILSFYVQPYIMNYILIAGLFQKKIIYTKLQNYSNYLLEEYLRPDSAFIMYKGLKWKFDTYINQITKSDSNVTSISTVTSIGRQICYINKNNQIVLFHIK